MPCKCVCFCGLAVLNSIKLFKFTANFPLFTSFEKFAFFYKIGLSLKRKCILKRLLQHYQFKVLNQFKSLHKPLRNYVKMYFKSSNKPLLFLISLKAVEPELPLGNLSVSINHILLPLKALLRLEKIVCS